MVPGLRRRRSLAPRPSDRSLAGFATAGYIVGGCAVFAAVVWLVTYLVELDRQKLPVSEDFSGECIWPVGSNHRSPANFDYGCRRGAYVLTLHNTGAYHVTQPVGVTADAVKYEIDASVASGRGTRPRVSPPSALLGIACMPRRQPRLRRPGGNQRDDRDRTLGGRLHRRRRAPRARFGRGHGRTANPGTVHLGIVCARQQDGMSLAGLYVNGVLIDAYRDRTGYRSFRQVAVYANTYPGTVGFDSFRACKPAESDLDAISAAAPGDAARSGSRRRHM